MNFTSNPKNKLKNKSMNLNKVLIFGNITRDIELKSLPSGTSVCNFSVATNERYKDKDGNIKESVEYHQIVSFGKQAENIARYMGKGSSILIEGRLQTRHWEKNGIKHQRTEIIAGNAQFGTKKTQSSDRPQYQQVIH